MNRQLFVSLFLFSMGIPVLSGMENPFALLDPECAVECGQGAVEACLAGGFIAEDLLGALDVAVANGDLDTTRLLLAKGAPLDNFQELLFCALEQERADIAELLYRVAIRVRKMKVCLEMREDVAICLPFKRTSFKYYTDSGKASVMLEGAVCFTRYQNCRGYWNFRVGEDFFIAMNGEGEPGLEENKILSALLINGKYFPLFDFLMANNVKILYPELSAISSQQQSPHRQHSPRRPRNMRVDLPNENKLEHVYSAPAVMLEGPKAPATPVGFPRKVKAMTPPGFDKPIAPTPGFGYLRLELRAGTPEEQWTPFSDSGFTLVYDDGGNE